MKKNCLTCSRGNHNCNKRNTKLETIKCEDYRQIKFKYTPIKMKNGTISYWIEVEE